MYYRIAYALTALLLLLVTSASAQEIHFDSFKVDPPDAGCDVPSASTADRIFSLRKTLDSYSGSAIRVQRSSDNTQQDVGFDGCDLDVSSMETFCGTGATDHCHIMTWYDQAGNANATAADTTVALKIMEDGTTHTGSNSKAAAKAEFSQSDRMTFTTWTDTGDLTLISLVRIRNDADDAFFTGTWNSSSHGFGGANDRVTARCNGTYTNVTGLSALSGWRVYSWRRESDNTMRNYRDGTEVGSGANAGSCSIDNIGDGLAEHWDELIHEVFVWSTDIGATAQGNVRSNISTYYSLGL